jgi:cytosine/adenosine deaminase-related metal-dependent hydrolase
VLPGLINTHHHFYQTLTRAIPAAQSCELFAWLKKLYPIWDARAVYVSAQMAAAELLMSGCTTASDHLYLFPNDCTLDEEIRALCDIGMRGVNVGLGVDGAASNDGSNMLNEARAACLLARVGARDAAAMDPRTALEIATRGGAQVLGRDDIGHLAPGMSADFIALDIDQAHFAGAHWDPVAALILCQPHKVDYSYVNGRKVVDRGRLVTADVEALIEQVNLAALAMAAHVGS